MFKNERIARLFLTRSGVPQDRVDALDSEAAMSAASQAFKTFWNAHQSVRHDMAQVQSAVEPLLNGDRSSGAIIQQLRRAVAYYASTRRDAVEDTHLWIQADVPLQTAIKLNGMVGFAAWERQEPPEDFHITLAYLGKHAKADLTPENLNTIVRSLSVGLKDYGPLIGSIAGYGRMGGKMGEGDAIYLSPGLKGLTEMRQFIKERVTVAGFPIRSEYDFIPHITLGFLPPGEPMPLIQLKPMDLAITSISLHMGNTLYRSIELMGDKRFDGIMSDTPSVAEAASPDGHSRMVKVGSEVFQVDMLRRLTFMEQYGDKIKVADRGLIAYQGKTLECFIGQDSSSSKIFRINEINPVSGEVTNSVIMLHFEEPKIAKQHYTTFKCEKTFGSMSMEPRYERTPNIAQRSRHDAKPKAVRQQNNGRAARKRYRATQPPQGDDDCGDGAAASSTPMPTWMKWTAAEWISDPMPQPLYPVRVDEHPVIVPIPKMEMPLGRAPFYPWDLSSIHAAALFATSPEIVPLTTYSLGNILAAMPEMEKLIAAIRDFRGQANTLTLIEQQTLTMMMLLRTTHLPMAPSYFASPIQVPELHRQLREVATAAHRLSKRLPQLPILYSSVQAIAKAIFALRQKSDPDKALKLNQYQYVLEVYTLAMDAHNGIDSIRDRIKSIKFYLSTLPYAKGQVTREKRDLYRQVNFTRSAAEQSSPNFFRAVSDLYSLYGTIKVMRVAVGDRYAQIIDAIAQRKESDRIQYLHQSKEQLALVKDIRTDVESTSQIGDKTSPTLVDFLQDTTRIDGVEPSSEQVALGLTQLALANFAIAHQGDPLVSLGAQYAQWLNQKLEHYSNVQGKLTDFLDKDTAINPSADKTAVLNDVIPVIKEIRDDIIDMERLTRSLELAVEKIPQTNLPDQIEHAIALQDAGTPERSIHQNQAIADQFMQQLKRANAGEADGVAQLYNLVEIATENSPEELPQLQYFALLLNNSKDSEALSQKAKRAQIRNDATEPEDVVDLIVERRIKEFWATYEPLIAEAEERIKKNGIKKGLTDADIKALMKVNAKQQVKFLENQMFISKLAGADEVLSEDPSKMRFDGLNNYTLEGEIGWRFDRKKVPEWLKMPPEDAIAYFSQKELLGTTSTKGIPGDIHQWAFMVSGVTRADILEAINWMLGQALESGITEENFQRQFNRLVGRRGFTPDAWRVRTIFETNMRSSYGAGRYLQQFDADLPEDRIFVYRHGDSVQPRPLHLALNNKGIPASHKFWDTAYPINGYGCKCRVLSLSPEMAKQKGIDIMKNPPDPNKIAEEGFRSNPSQVFNSENREAFKEKSLARLSPTIRKQMVDING